MKKQTQNFKLKKQTISTFTTFNILGGEPTVMTLGIDKTCPHPNDPVPTKPAPLSAGKECTIRTWLGGC